MLFHPYSYKKRSNVQHIEFFISHKKAALRVRRSSGRSAAADSWYTTGWESRGSGAPPSSGRFQSVRPRRAELWCPLAGRGGRPLCILPLSGTGNRHTGAQLSGPKRSVHQAPLDHGERGRRASQNVKQLHGSRSKIATTNHKTCTFQFPSFANKDSGPLSWAQF